jgi:hypothetical protein
VVFDYSNTHIDGFPYVYCIIKMAIVAKGIPHFCNYEFPNIAKAIAGTH